MNCIISSKTSSGTSGRAPRDGVGAFLVPEHPAHADEFADAHQGPGRHGGIHLPDLAGELRRLQPGDVAVHNPGVVQPQGAGRNELGLADDPVERRVLRREPEERPEPGPLGLEPGAGRCGRPRSWRAGPAG